MINSAVRVLGDYSIRKFLLFSANPFNWAGLAKLRAQKKSEIEHFRRSLAKHHREGQVDCSLHFVFRNWIVGKPAPVRIEPALSYLLRETDPELRMRADRLSWALELSASDPAYAWSEVEKWFALRVSPLAFYQDSYSASERISNLIMLWNLYSPNDRLERHVKSLIVNDANLVMRNPEYHGELNTNNHILNNARALILAGSFLDSQCLFDAGCWIFTNQFDKHINSDGVLREGSSHYQYVVTRWVVDIACAFLYRDKNYFERIQQKFNLMLDVCDRMARSEAEHWYLPLIGDISPDFPPQFYQGLTSFGRRLVRASQNDPNQEPHVAVSNRGFWSGYFGGEESRVRGYKWLAADCSWASIKHGPWSLLAHVDTAFQDPRATHGHHDLFSFDLSAFGVPIIVDPGRSNYTSLRDKEDAGILEEWHNTVIVGGVRTGFVPRGYMPAKWLKSFRPKPRVEINSEELAISLNAIPNLRPRASVERLFKAHLDEGLRIRTRVIIQDSAALPVRQVLYVAGNVRIEEDRATIQTVGGEISIRWNNLAAPTVSKTSNYISYAKGVTCTRLEWNSKASGPNWESEFHITPNEEVK